MKILFSIIIPVYNVEKYLEKCLNSVLNQTYSNFEIVLINDGSTDYSGNICDDFAKLDKRIKVFHQQNQGLLLTRRNALEKITGDFYLFLDSDDYWDYDLLETVYNTILEEDCDMVIFKYRKVLNDKVNVIQDAVFEDKTVFTAGNKDILFKKLISSSNLNNLCNKVVKSSLIDSNNYFKFRNVKNGEDLLQSLPLLYNAQKIFYIDRALYNYRVNPESITQTFNIGQFENIITVRSVVLEYMKKLNMDNEENLKLFFHFLLRKILDYIANLIISNYTKKEKKSILLQIKNTPMYRKSLNYISISEFPLKYRIRFFLFKRNYLLLYFFENCLLFLRYIRKHLRQNL